MESIERKLDLLLQQQKETQRQTWLKASQIMALTGWDKTQMHRARQNGWILQRRDEMASLICWRA